MAEKADYYETLGVSKGAADAQIKSAYRNLARKHHPDVDKADGAEKKVKEINEAYQVLSAPQKKAAYDQYCHSAFEQGGGFGGAGQGPFQYSWSTDGGQGFGGF